MKSRILLVEDEIIVAMDIQQRLENLEYQVVGHAVSGEEAVRLVRSLEPELILMDVKLQGKMDGIEAAMKIRNFSDIPIIYLTAFADNSTINRARLTEAFGYLVKPFEDRELHSNIELALYKHTIEHKLRESEERYALAAQAANDGLWDWNLKTNKIYYSPRWKSILGLNGPETSSLAEWTNRIHPEDLDRLLLNLDAHLKGVSDRLECEYRILHKDGSYHWMLCRGLARRDSHGNANRIAGSQSDITYRKNIEQQLIHKAIHDELTGLPNRTLLIDRLGVACERIKLQSDQLTAILVLDIDHFKKVNEGLGHDYGDQLLMMIAQRFKTCVRPGDTVARLGGDEFAILLDGIHQEEDALRIADHILEESKKPFRLTDQEVFSSISIGIVFASSHDHAVDLLQAAETAMYMAKHNGRGRFEVFSTPMREQARSRLQLENDMRRALDNHEFCVFYQPIYSISDLRLTGVEALVRWQHPVRGLLLPMEFIGSAEETGIIVPLGEWVLQTACRQAMQWQALGLKDLQISVNISASQFKEYKLVEMVKQALIESGLPPNNLELEITESVAMEDMDRTVQILSALSSLGVQISIDDFGSGYSSLENLKLFPANILKIDRSFISDLKPNDVAIIQAMINLAHQLKLSVIAEGVESNKQLDLLTSLTCDRVQGYLFGKAMPPNLILETALANLPLSK